MTDSPGRHFAFFTAYTGITNKLTTRAGIRPVYTDGAARRGGLSAVKALWDTGATMTCIKPALRERLKMRLLESGGTEIAGIGGRTAAGATVVNLLVVPGLEIKNCPVYVIDFPGDAELLIGMNIISKGDFAVCNAGGATSFSFAVPPFPGRINLEDRAEAANRRGTL